MCKEKVNIEKFSGSISKEDGGFTTFINSSLRSITDGFAAGVYVYLLSLPPDWELNPKQLANHYHCDKKTIYNALNVLREAGLLTREDLREKGRFVKFHYVVHLHPVHKKDISKPTKSQLNTGVSPVPVLPEMVKPEMVKRNTYKRNTIQNKESKKTTTTLAREKKSPSSSSGFVISKEIDGLLLTLRAQYMPDDERKDHEFLRQCSHHLDNGDKNKYNMTRRVKGLEAIIKKGFFEKPAGYEEKKIIKSLFTPEEKALVETYKHALKLEKLGIKMEDFIPDPQNVQKAMKLLEKIENNKPSLSKRFGSMLGFDSMTS